jgi:hypothetical protein
MRRATPLVLVLLLYGCVVPGDTRPESVTAFKPPAAPPAADVIGLEVSLLEVPIGDHYANGELWATIDEQVVAPEKRAALDDNGFRVGVIGGVRPSQFDDILHSPRSNPKPQWVQTRVGRPKLVPLSPQRPVCEYRIFDRDTPGPTTAFDQARCVVQVTPSLAADGGVKLAFVPQVQHGARTVWSAPLDGDGILPPAESYPALGWDMTLAAGEFLLIGTRFERTDTLGRACFVEPDEVKPVQRLLAIRAVRPANQ